VSGAAGWDVGVGAGLGWPSVDVGVALFYGDDEGLGIGSGGAAWVGVVGRGVALFAGMATDWEPGVGVGLVSKWPAGSLHLV